MLFSFLSVSPATELKLRMKKAKAARVTKRSLRLQAEERVKRYEEAMSVEHVVSGLLSDCVEAVCEMLIEKGRRQYPKVKKKEESKEKAVTGEEETVTGVVREKRQRIWSSWLERCYVIFMFLHPLIFKGNATEACAVLGIPRSTLLGWVSCSPKKNYVAKWFDTVENLTWGDVKGHISHKITNK